MVDRKVIATVNIGSTSKSSERIDHKYTNVPVCPWCGWTDDGWWDGSGLEGDGATEKTECGDCEQPFETTMYVSYDFCTEKRDVAEEERLEAERKERHEAQRLKRLAGVEALPPGTRVKVVRGLYRGNFEKTGTVANEEVNKHNPHVHVLLDDSKSPRAQYFDADDLERIEE